jgi:hypothetical protein
MRNKHGLLSINCTQYGAVEPVVAAVPAARRRQYGEHHHMVTGALHNLAVAEGKVRR